MKKRWIINLVMLALVAGMVTFLYMRPKANTGGEQEYAVSALKLADFDAIKVEFPTQAPLQFEKKDSFWHMTAPYKVRADQLSVQRILAIIAATSKEKFPAGDLEKFGLTNPQLKIKLKGPKGEETFVFGTYNSVTEDQYLSYQDAVYLVKSIYSDAATVQPIELVDKMPLSPSEVKQITGFNFAHLEQWEDAKLQVDIKDGKWTSNHAKAKLSQDELNEWLEFSWKQGPAKQVELYTPDHKVTYPSFDVKLSNGKTVHFDKIQEAPELLLGRADEGVLYHFTNDAGFTMLNPPLNLQ
jgi:Domain of unknown function (DUF4340)